MASSFFVPLRVGFVSSASDHLWLGGENETAIGFLKSVNQPVRQVYGGKQICEQKHTCVGLGIYQITHSCELP